MSIEKKPPTQRTLNALETKNNMFNMALYLFKKHGYDKVTVDDITSRAGVSKGTFYTHFSSKESVLMEQFKKIDDYYDEALSKIPKDMPAGERLLVLIDAMTHYCANICGVEFLQIVYASQISPGKTIKILNNKNRRLYCHLRDIVAYGKETGDFIFELEQEALVEILARAARGLIYDWCLYSDEMDLQAEGQRYFRILLRHIHKISPLTE